MSNEAHRANLEPGGVSNRWVLALSAGFLMLLASSIVVLGFIFYYFVPGNRTVAIKEFPAPRQEARPATELHALLARQRREMSGYRWANSEHTLVAIPIKRAMRIIASRGNNAFAPLAGSEPGNPSAPATQGVQPTPKQPIGHPAGTPQSGSSTGGKL